MRIYLIRHGETDLNKHKILQGRSDHELNEYGRELACVTGKALKDVSFDLVFTSPLKRAKETAQLLISENERSVQPPIIDEERIQEISFGDFEGKCYGKDNFNMPDPDFLNFFEKPEAYKTPPGGESFEEVLSRTGSFLRELAGNGTYKDKTILVSTHGCALKAILANVSNTPIPEFWGDGVHRNCAVSIVDVTDGVSIVREDGRVYY